MNVGIVLPSFPSICKIFFKSLRKCENKVEIKNKMLPPEIYFPDGEHRHETIFKLLQQSIYWTDPLHQHLSAFLAGWGGQWLHLAQAYNPVQVEK